MTGTLHGKVYLGTAARDAIEAAIPDGCAIQVKTTAAYWLLYLHGPNGGRVYSGPLRVSRGMALETACLFALDRWEGVAS